LVRKLCLHCHGKGCTECGHTGYQGRTGIFELLSTNEAMRSLSHDPASEPLLRDAAQRQGMTSLREDGQRLVSSGVTSMEELVRVTRD
jgi:general secretion pathway protein E